MKLEWFDTRYTVWRMPADWQASKPVAGLFAVLHTPDEVTVVCPVGTHPHPSSPMDRESGPWSLFRIADELPHDAVGIMARLSGVLAEAGIPILPFGSYDTDYVLVPSAQLEAARAALLDAGYVT